MKKSSLLVRPLKKIIIRMVVESSISSRNIRNWNKLISIEVEGNVVKRLSIDYEGADPELLVRLVKRN